MKTLVIAPHPDDEILGAGGTMLRRKEEGHETAWVIATCISTEYGWSVEQVQKRTKEIEAVRQLMRFDEVYQLGLPTTQLDLLPMKDIVGGITEAFNDFQPNEILLPHYSDIHTDHSVLFRAASSCTKWFRHSYVTRIMCYETLSETDFCMNNYRAFSPNYFINITAHLGKKIEALNIYSSEIREFPFPRSLDAVRALAAVRGATSGYVAAEAFELLRERS